MTTIPSARRPWPLLVIASSAFVAVWGGWVSLGGLTGFGVIAPLPGIVDHFTINTAVTLPLGVEAYAAYALAVATSATATTPARRFAVRSAVAALGLGILGQVASHVLSAAHAVTAPLLVTIFVSCMPVVVVGAAARLWHLSGRPAVEPNPEPVASRSAPVDPVAPRFREALSIRPEPKPEPALKPDHAALSLRSVPTGSAQERAAAELRRRGLVAGQLPGRDRDEIATSLNTSPDTVRRAHRAIREAAGAAG